MDIAERRRAAESAFLKIVDEADLDPPDDVEHDGHEVVFLWNERKLVVVVDCSEGAPEFPVGGGAGGWGQA